MENNNLDRINFETQMNSYSSCLNEPIRWKFKALKLKHAADRLYNRSLDAFYNWEEFVNSEHNEYDLLEGDKVIDQDFYFTYDMELLMVYYLLIGFAFENLIKAHIIKNKVYLKKSKALKFPNILKDHDLVNLCKKAKLEISQKESTLLNNISEFVIWEGRYPIPINHVYKTPRKNEDGTWTYSAGLISNYSIQIDVNRLFNRFLSIYEEK
ncbi:MAG TPA: hypothetical protein PLR56_01515 [Brevefilum sp.]|nr:hypothetical protein [Brevefilum sp.]HPL68850.1 hypothetical protein [Brevefilum sp.]